MIFMEKAVRDFWYCEALVLQKTEAQVKDVEKEKWYERNGEELRRALQTKQPSKFFMVDEDEETTTVSTYEGHTYVVHPDLGVIVAVRKVESGEKVSLHKDIRKQYVESRHGDVERKLANITMMVMGEYAIDVDEVVANYDNRTIVWPRETLIWDELEVELVSLKKSLEGGMVNPSYKCKFCSWKECPERRKTPPPALDTSSLFEGVAEL